MLRRLRGWITPRASDGTPVAAINADDDSDVALLDPLADDPNSFDSQLLIIDVPSSTASSNGTESGLGQPTSGGGTLATERCVSQSDGIIMASGQSVAVEPSPAGTTAARHGRHERSSSRHRSRRHRHHHSRSRLCRCKRKETNFLASMCSMVSVVLVCTSLAEPDWFYVNGGRCKDYRNNHVNHLGVKLFFYQGWFSSPASGSSSLDPQSIYHYSNSQEDELRDCVTPSVVLVMKCIIANCFFVIVFSMIAFILDLVGPTHRVLKSVRSNAIFSVLSACICMTINGLSYLITELLSANYQKYPLHEGSKIDVQFSLSFYIITAAGTVSVMGSACNLLRRPTSGSEHRSSSGSSSDIHRDRLMANLDSIDVNLSACSQLAFLPAPPPYSP